MQRLRALLNGLHERKIFSRLDKFRDRVVVEIALPGRRWEAGFMRDGSIRVEKFVSTGGMFECGSIDRLFDSFFDRCGSPLAAARSVERMRSLPVDEEEGASIRQLLTFLDELEKRQIFYRLDKVRDRIVAEIALPGERWEAAFSGDGSVDIEKFTSTGEIFDCKEIDRCEEIDRLFDEFSDRPE